MLTMRSSNAWMNVAPAFSADCIETLEEIAIQGKDTFLEAGGEKFAYIPCLNASPAGMDMIEAMVRRELAGRFRAEDVADLLGRNRQELWISAPG